MDEHRWTQQRISQYFDGELSGYGRRRFDRHAQRCAECSRAVRAMRALIYAMQGLGGPAGVHAPATIFSRVRLAGAAGQGSPEQA
jgi:anti-sigma factor RsiW